MRDHLAELLRQVETAPEKRNLAREYLQARILEALQLAGAFRAWAFLGGTALRFLFSLPRFSEDLDFSLVSPADQPPPDFRALLESVKRRLTAENYDVEVKVNDRRTVHAAFISFSGLLQGIGLSGHRTETLAIKIELDTRPPAGASIETTLVRRHIVLNLPHYDRGSLLAGKIHALLVRPYLKGRDVFDLAWYLADRTWPPPNLPLLRSALEQTSWDASMPTTRTWKSLLRRRLETADWKTVQSDVEPFLERPTDRLWVTPDHILPLLRNEPADQL